MRKRSTQETLGREDSPLAERLSEERTAEGSF